MQSTRLRRHCGTKMFDYRDWGDPNRHMKIISAAGSGLGSRTWVTRHGGGRSVRVARAADPDARFARERSNASRTPHTSRR